MKIYKHRYSSSMVNLLVSVILLTFFGLSCRDMQVVRIEPSELKCEYSDTPLGIEKNNPRLSWILHSDIRSQKQSAYRILVASSAENLERNIGDLWDSHKVISDESVHIVYNGKALTSGLHCWWKVCVWDRDNKKSDWSETASWEMGLLNAEDWKAKWISYKCQSAPFFRKEFKITKEVKEARVYISGLGYYELRMNGSKIGDHVLDPAQTDYEKRTFYVVYDVTDNIRIGNNVAGIVLGNGWYNQTAVNHGKYGWKDVVYGQPRFIFQMRLIYTDGTDALILSDETWKGSEGPILTDNVYAGEVYDARLEQPGWDTPAFDDSTWDQAIITEGPGGKLISQQLPPIKKIRYVYPLSLSNPKPGIYVYDMGQNFAGWVKLKVAAPKGTEITLRFSEWLKQDGMIDPASTGVYATKLVQTDKYICSGLGIEEWEPRFTYHGYRYVELVGFPEMPSLDNVVGISVHTDVKTTGGFTCSDTMINKLHRTALWTELSNLHGVPTDCPHRERCGWLGDAFLTSDMSIYNFDMALFWSKFIDDIETSSKDGVPPNIAPGKRYGGSDPDWGASWIQLPWNMYLYYGDTSIIRKHYKGMGMYMDYLQETAIDNLIYEGIGSLFSPGRISPETTPKAFTSSALYFFCAKVMAQMAGVMGREMDEIDYERTAQDIKSSFNIKFYCDSGFTYGNQENNALALAFGLMPDNDELRVSNCLYSYIANEQSGYFSTGIFGNRYIFEILSRYGFGDAVVKMLNKTTYPGYGYLFSRGATTFWENWGELAFEDNGRPGDERSKNHPFRGGFDAWFFNGLGGILPDPDHPGFKQFIIKPQKNNTLKYVKTTYNSIHGMIRSEWRDTGDESRYLISVPVNSSAMAYIPSSDKNNITEGGISATDTEGAEFHGMENGSAVFKLGSGNYEFVVKKN